VLRRPAWRPGLALLALAALCAPSTALAAFGKDTTPLPAGVTSTAGSEPAPSSSTGGSFLRMVIGLVVVIAVIYGVWFALRTWGKAKRGLKKRVGMGGDGIEVIATTPLAQNRSIHLVRVGGELILVGSAEQGITQLRVYSPEESERIEHDLHGGGPPPAGADGPVLVSELEQARSGRPQSWKGNNWTSMAEEIRRRTARG
jgi:flagellar biogenesis protein FliO